MCVNGRDRNVKDRRNLPTVVAIAMDQDDDQSLPLGEASQGSRQPWLDIG
jgi:hypothetical protein